MRTLCKSRGLSSAASPAEGFSLNAVVCFIIYFLLGFFGAARWGTDTNNNLLGIYLALTNPPLVYPVAHILRVSQSARCTQ